MQPINTISEKDIGPDGKPRRKYEIAEEIAQAAGTKFAIGALLASAILAMKNILFGSSEADELAQNSVGHLEPVERIVETSSSGDDVTKVGSFEEPNSSNDGEEDADGSDIDELEPSRLASSSTNASRFSDDIPTNAQATFSPVFNTGMSSPDVLPVASNVVQFPIIPRPRPPVDTGSSGGRDGIGNPASRSNQDNPYQDDEEDKEGDDRAFVNRLPTLIGPVVLSDLYINQSIVIAMSDFLDGASDADGDNLQVQNLSASSGTLQDNGNGTWTYSPEAYDIGEVTFNYEIADAHGSVPQIAQINFLPLPGSDFFGTEASDTIIGTPGSDRIYARSGDDTIIAREDSDVVDAGAGDDRVLAGLGDDVVYGRQGNDVIFGGQGNDIIFGGQGDDFLSGDEGDDTLFGEEGNDTLLGGAGNDHAFGGDGDDIIQGQAGDDLLDGGSGSDYLQGGDGADVIIAGLDADTGEGGAGDDTFIATAFDGDDDYDGGEGTDSYDISGTSADADINLVEESASSTEIGEDTITEIENVVGGHGDDFIVGDDEDNYLTGNIGEDEIHGNGGGDVLDGGDDNDHLYGDEGDDTIIGGSGSDTGEGGAGDDTFIATAYDDDDDYDGGDGEDSYDVSGTSADATIDLNKGHAYSDEIGDDTIANFENAVGGHGNDVIVANNLGNSLAGGPGQDIFVFLEGNKSGKGGQVRDQIEDFEVGDKIDVSLIDGNAAEAGWQRLIFRYDQATFDGVGQVQYHYEDQESGTYTVLQFNFSDDDDDDNDADYEIEIVGRHDLNDENLIT